VAALAATSKRRPVNKRLLPLLLRKSKLRPLLPLLLAGNRLQRLPASPRLVAARRLAPPRMQRRLLLARAVPLLLRLGLQLGVRDVAGGDLMTMQ
jgi:hypothetical protein